MKTNEEFRAEVEAMTEEQRMAVVLGFLDRVNAVLPETAEMVEFIRSKHWSHGTVTTILIRLLAGSVVGPVAFPDPKSHETAMFLTLVRLSEVVGEVGNDLIQKYGEKDHADVPGVQGEGGGSGVQGEGPRA